jgi:hypothetical protein
MVIFSSVPGIMTYIHYTVLISIPVLRMNTGTMSVA